MKLLLPHLTRAQIRDAVRAIDPDTAAGWMTFRGAKLWAVRRFRAPGSPVVGRGRTEREAWADALMTLQRPRLYTEPET